MRGVLLRRTVRPGPTSTLTLVVAADPGRAWRLSVFAGNDRLVQEVVDGGPPIEWTEQPPLSYPESEFAAMKAARVWRRIGVDLAPYAGREIVLRLYQTTLVRDRVPGNAYWKPPAVR